MSTIATRDVGVATAPARIRRLPGPTTRLPLTWAMAGGVVAGGLLVAAATLAGRVSSSSVTAVSTVLFVMGGAAGLVHGGLLAWLARPTTMSRGQAAGQVAASVLWLLPGGVAAWIVTIWIGLTAASLHLERLLVAAGVLLGWGIGLAICGWAVVEGASALRVVFRRRPDHRWSALAASLVFGILVGAFHSLRPEIPFTGFHVSGGSAVFLALVASVWIALPVAVACLELLARVRSRR